jgi:hypothetical protein
MINQQDSQKTATGNIVEASQEHHQRPSELAEEDRNLRPIQKQQQQKQ